MALATHAAAMAKLTDFVTEWQLPDQRAPRREPAVTARPDQLDRHPSELRVHHRDAGVSPRSAP